MNASITGYPSQSKAALRAREILWRPSSLRIENALGLSHDFIRCATIDIATFEGLANVIKGACHERNDNAGGSDGIVSFRDGPALLGREIRLAQP